MLYINETTRMIELRCEPCGKPRIKGKTVLHLNEYGMIHPTCKDIRHTGGNCDAALVQRNGGRAQEHGWYELNPAFLLWLALGSGIPVSDVECESDDYPISFKVAE
jgi:hypothetical protein